MRYGHKPSKKKVQVSPYPWTKHTAAWFGLLLSSSQTTTIYLLSSSQTTTIYRLISLVGSKPQAGKSHDLNINLTQNGTFNSWYVNYHRCFYAFTLFHKHSTFNSKIKPVLKLKFYFNFQYNSQTIEYSANHLSITETTLFERVQIKIKKTNVPRRLKEATTF